MSILDHVVRLARAEGVLEGFDAAVRADVADFVGWCEREAARCEGDAWRMRAVEHYSAIARLSTGKAAWLRSQAADCRKWLEAVQ